jgi:TolB-like protein
MPLAGIAAIGVLTIGALMWALSGNREGSTLPPAGLLSIDGLAVLPLANNSGNPEKEYVADGITQTLIASLSRLPHLKVISRNSVFGFKGKTSDVTAIARQLGVGAVMTGVLSEADGQVVIDVELSDAKDGSVILSHKYVQPAGSGVLAMQSEIARDVAERLQLKLTGEDHRQLASVATANSEAYQHFLKGLFYVRQGTQASLHKGIETFQKAITLDPSYAQAYASIAQAYLELGLFYEAPRDAMPKARQFARRSKRIPRSLTRTSRWA